MDPILISRIRFIDQVAVQLMLLPIWLLRWIGPLIHEKITLIYYLVPILVLLVTRSLFLIFDAITLYRHSSSPPEPKRKSYSIRDVTVVCLIDADDDLEEFLAAILSWQSSGVAAAVVVVARSSKNYGIALSALSNLTTLPYRLLRSWNDHALVTGCNNVTTPLMAVTSPNLIWSSSNMIEWVLVPLDQPNIGVVAPSIELYPHRPDRVSIRELLFDMVLSRQNAVYQIYDAISSTLHSLPNMFLIRTSILQDSVFQKMIRSDQLITDRLWTWVLESDWDVAFQRSNQSSTSVKCPRSWLKLIQFGDAGLRRAQVLISGRIWRRHSLLSIRILFEVLDVLLILYLQVCMVLVPVLKPAWPIWRMASVLILGLMTANFISMIVYWAQHPIDVIYYPLYLTLNLIGFCSQIIPILRRSRQIRSVNDRELVVDQKLQEEEIVEKKVPILLIPGHVPPDEKLQMGAAAA